MLERYCFSRLKARVAVVSNLATREWLEGRTQGFFVTESDAACRWTVFAGKEYAPSRSWTTYRRNSVTGEECRFLVDESAFEVVIDLRPGVWRDLYVLRMVRNIMRWELFHHGAVFLHANCVAKNGKALAILGDSRTGKTSLTLSLLRSGNWDYVTEDDLTLMPQPNGTFLALGWPGCVRIRRSMLSQIPEVGTQSKCFAHPANVLERYLDPEIGLLRIFPEEVSALFHCKVYSEAPLGACIWTSWSNRTSILAMPSGIVASRLRQSWDILPERKAGARPHANNSETRDWERMVFDPFFLHSFGVPPLRRFKHILRDVAAKVSCFSMTHSGDHSSSESAIRQCVEGIG